MPDQISTMHRLHCVENTPPVKVPANSIPFKSGNWGTSAATSRRKVNRCEFAIVSAPRCRLTAFPGSNDRLMPKVPLCRRSAASMGWSRAQWPTGRSVRFHENVLGDPAARSQFLERGERGELLGTLLGACSIRASVGIAGSSDNRRAVSSL